MKRIGLLGGMSWESTAEYYRLINRETNRILGDLHSSDCAVVSFDFQPIEELQHRGEWSALERILTEGARRLEAAGAEIILLCSNTMHALAGAVQDAVSTRFLHIADPAAGEARRIGAWTVGLMGTRFTMERDFYSSRLETLFGLKVLTPEPDERALIHRIIYRELCMGRFEEASAANLSSITERLKARGAEAVILGCTELPLSVKQEMCDVPLLDTTRLHALEAVRQAIDVECHEPLT